MSIDFHTLTEHLERVYSPRIALRQVAVVDSWPLYEATQNPLFNRFLLWPQPEEEAQALARVDSIVDAARAGRMAALSAVVRSTGEWVSLFRFQPYAANTDFVEMGVWTHDKFWHGRYSLELGRICVDAAFEFSDIATLVGASSPDNKSSCHLMEMCGLTSTRLVYRPHESGSEVLLQEFAITREEWLAQSRAHSYKQVPHFASVAIAQQAGIMAPRSPFVSELRPSYVARIPEPAVSEHGELLETFH